MSVTTLQNPLAYQAIPSDYDLQHSEEELGSVPAEPNERPEPEGTGENPAVWTVGWRRVPVHRPIDYNLDVAFRSTTQNGIETFFLFNMFNGIRIVSALNRTWRATGGRINDRIFRWQIGGEW